MFELGQSIPRMGHIRIGHGWIFTQHIHAANIARVHGIHDFCDGETFVGIQRLVHTAITTPDLCKF